MDSLAKANLPPKAVKFNPEDHSYKVIKFAQETEEVDLLQEDLELEFGIVLNRRETRELIAYAHNELMQDLTAAAPTSVTPLSAKIDGSLNHTIDLLVAESKTLADMAQQPEGKKLKLHTTGEILDPMAARDRLNRNTTQLLEIKKHLNDQKKAEAGPGNPTMGVNLNLGLGTIISGALKNIKEAEAVEVLQSD